MCRPDAAAVPLTSLFHPSDAWLDSQSNMTDRYTLWRASEAGRRAISDAVAAWKHLLAERGASSPRNAPQGFSIAQKLIMMRLVFAGIPEPATQRKRWQEEEDLAALLTSHGVAPDADAAARMAATKTLQKMTARTVDRDLEALSFLGWSTMGVSAEAIYRAGPHLVTRTAYCRAHG